MNRSLYFRRIRLWLLVFITGLLLSGITASPLQTEAGLSVKLLGTGSWKMIAVHTHLLAWIEQVNQALRDTNAHYPFLAYGTDWLAFAHLVIAVVFIGPYLDPVRN